MRLDPRGEATLRAQQGVGFVEERKCPLRLRALRVVARDGQLRVGVRRIDAKRFLVAAERALQLLQLIGFESLEDHPKRGPAGGISLIDDLADPKGLDSFRRKPREPQRTRRGNEKAPA